MRYIWIDVPSGWKYGFPRMLEWSTYQKVNLEEWAISHGYPKELFGEDKMLHWVRTWEATDEDVSRLLHK